MKDLKLFINNQWVESENGGTFESVNPATKEVIAKVASATKNDVNKAVSSAKKAFDSGGWPDLDADERADYMIKAANIMRRRADELAISESMDVGKPIDEAKNADIPISIRAMEYAANMAREVRGSVIPLPKNEAFDYVTYEPYGVVATIVPWNFPLHIATRSICPAIATGNTVVLKPSVLASVTCNILGEIFLEAGFPEGILNIITGPGDVAGEALILHPDVNMISFTGSVESGRRVIKASAENNIKKVLLELGGKGPFIAEYDCNLNAAVNSVLRGFAFMQGEVCCASTRLYIHEKIYDEFISLLVKRANSIKIGNPQDPTTQLGSLISEDHLKKVDAFVRQAINDGAKLLCGGEKYVIPPCDKGSFYKPTILECMSNKMNCVQDEIFGPVLVALKYKNIDEAIALANDNQYGLEAAIWSENYKTLYWVARKLNAGWITMNATPLSRIESPYGGNKNSGLGREDGVIGLMEYLKAKTNYCYIAKEYEKFYGF
jgi:acyl-CoA reductase-like NAD-dependent aldehyde dehydrogenase